MKTLDLVKYANLKRNSTKKNREMNVFTNRSITDKSNKLYIVFTNKLSKEGEFQLI